MEIKYGRNYELGPGPGPGVGVVLSGEEVATAIEAYLVAHKVYVSGPRTTTVNGKLCRFGCVFVYPEGDVIKDGERVSGRGPKLGKEGE